MTKARRAQPRNLSPLEGIMTFCMACRCAGDMEAVGECGKADCPLHPFRLGKQLDHKETGGQQ